jgi:hypothetical protein
MRRAVSAVSVDGPLLLAAVPGCGMAGAARLGMKAAGRCAACRGRVILARVRVHWHATDTVVELEPAPPVYVLERAYRHRRELVCRRAGGELVPLYVAHTCTGRP